MSLEPSAACYIAETGDAELALSVQVRGRRAEKEHVQPAGNDISHREPDTDGAIAASSERRVAK